jgi:hypothetical protein
MLTGFYFQDEDEIWWEKEKHLSEYTWVFNEGHGSKCCLIFTYSR